MAKKQEIEFIIRPDGSVEERVTGVSGSNCEAVTQAVEEALGQITRREHTGEFYQQPDTATDTISARS